MKYTEAVEYIESLQQYGIVPGLGNIRNLCEKLGNPQDELKFVHIAGTNGKGSVLAYISTILKEAGYKVGRYVSPTIFEYRERIQVNHRPITQKALCELVERMQGICRILLLLRWRQLWRFNILRSRVVILWCWKPAWVADRMLRIS